MSEKMPVRRCASGMGKVFTHLRASTGRKEISTPGQRFCASAIKCLNSASTSRWPCLRTSFVPKQNTTWSGRILMFCSKARASRKFCWPRNLNSEALYFPVYILCTSMSRPVSSHTMATRIFFVVLSFWLLMVSVVWCDVRCFYGCIDFSRRFFV